MHTITLYPDERRSILGRSTPRRPRDIYSRAIRWLALALLVIAGTAVALASEFSPSDPNDPGETPVFGHYIDSGPVPILPGSAAFAFTAPGYDPITFHAAVEALPEYPGSLMIPDSPFGAGILLMNPTPGGCSYYLGFLSVGQLLPLSWGTDQCAYSGGVGALQYTVAQDPSRSGPGWSLLPGAHPGETVIEFEESGDAFFVQFFTMKVTWEGIDANGNPTSGTAPPLPWEGNTVSVDGSTVYVDSTNPNGEYGGVTGTRNAGTPSQTTFIRDAPNVMNPCELANIIQSAPMNAGVTVTSLRIESHFTTYAGLRLLGGGQQITKKYEWTHVELIDLSTATVPDFPNGSFSGRNGTPDPVGSSASGLDPQHFQAMGTYLYGSNSGAPSTNGW